MPPAKKRKTAAKAKGAKKNHVVTAETEPDTQPDTVDDAPPAPEPSEEEPAIAIVADKQITMTDAPAPAPAPEPEPEPEPAATLLQEPEPSSSSSAIPTPAPPAAPTVTMADRRAQFLALKARQKASTTANLTAAQTEAHRLKHDPAQLNSLQRKAGVAKEKLVKAEIEDAGGDYQRQRNWGYTIAESERWDERLAERAAHRDNNAFQDFGAEAGRVYDRQVRNLGAPDLERHEKARNDAIERGLARGTLELVETEDGEMVAVDRDGTFSGGRDVISSFADSKPDKAAVDRLVGEMKKNDEITAKKRRERMARNGEEEGDVTYINDKNKHFNQKLGRFYDKYTKENRDSFERGTAI